MARSHVSEVFRRVSASPWLVPGVSLALFSVEVGLALRRGSALTFYDERDYDAIARALVEGRGFATAAGPTAFRPPAQSIWLAAAYAVFGPSVVVARVAQAALASALPPLAVWFSRPILKHAGQANLVGLGCALHPGLLYAATTLYPVSLTSVALLLGVGLAGRVIERGGAARAVVSGLALGVAAVASPYLTPLGLVAGLLAGPRRLLCAVLLTAASLLPMGAWVARNAVVMGAPVVGTHGGYNLALGANERATVWSGNAIEPDLSRAEAPDDEILRDRAYRSTAVAWIRSHPVRWSLLAVGRGLATLESSGSAATGDAPRGAMVRAASAGLLIWLVAGLVGLLRHRREPTARLTLAALVLVVVSAGVTIAKARFRFPCDPLLAAFGVALLRRAPAAIRARKREGQASPPLESSTR